MRASDVMEAEVEDDRMTWRKGCSKAGVSNVVMSVLSQHLIAQMSSAVHTFTCPQFAPQLCKGRHKGVVLQTLALLAPRPPSPAQTIILLGNRRRPTASRI
jgi:hypothetical protein